MAGENDTVAAAAAADVIQPNNPGALASDTAPAPVQADLASAAATAAPVAEVIPPSPAADAGAQPADPAKVPEPAPSLLEEFDAKKATEAKPADKPADAPADAPKPEAAKPEADKPADGLDPDKPTIEEPPALAPIDYFADETGVKIPETLKIDDAAKADVVKAFDAFRADPSKGAQGLIDMHAKALGDLALDMRTKQWEAFGDVRQGWKNRTMADPVLGGAGHDTAMGNVARVRDALVTTAKEGTPEHAKHMEEFQEMLAATGVGDHPAFLRMLHNGARFFDEARQPPPNPRPTKDNGRAPGARKQIYTNTQFPK